MRLLVQTKGYKLFTPFFSGIGHILMFHRVCPESERPRIPFNTLMEVTPQYLEQTILFFKEQDYEFISMDTLYQRFKEKNFNKKFVVVTFDDGYMDNLIYGLPVFQKHQVPFTIYVSTNFPNHNAVLWWDLLEDVILERDQIDITIDDQPLSFSCATMAEKEDTYSRIRSIIINFNESEFLEKIRSLFTVFVDNLYQKTKESALSWEQILTLSQDPLVTIGAHTLNHYALKNLSTEHSRFEIYESKKEIESHIHTPVEHFAYPFGGFAEVGKKDLEITEACGFKTAVATIPGNVFSGHQDTLFFLPRIQLYETFDLTKIQLFIKGFTQFKLHKFKRIVTL